MAIIRKGDAYALPVIILAGGTPITDADVAGVRIGLGTITAIWPDGQLRYDSGVWLLPITQAQSYTLPQGDIYYQAQVQMASGETLSSPRAKIHIDSSIFRQPWGKRELDTGGSVEASAVTAAVSLQPESIAAEIQNPGVVYGRDAVKYTPQTLTDEQKRQARENIGAAAPYVLPQATADALGGIKADAKTEDDVLPVRIDTDGKLWAPQIVDATADYNASGAAGYPEWASMADANDSSTYRVQTGTYCIGGFTIIAIFETTDYQARNIMVIDQSVGDGFVYVATYGSYRPGDFDSFLNFDSESKWLRLYGNKHNLLLPDWDYAEDNGRALKIVGGEPAWQDVEPIDAIADVASSELNYEDWAFSVDDNDNYTIKPGIYRVASDALVYIAQ